MQRIKLSFLFTLIFVSNLVFAQVAEPKPEKPTSGTRSKTPKTAVQDPQTLPLSGDAGLLVMVDYSSTLYVDGLRIGDFDQGTSWPYKIMAGTHLIQLKSEDDTWDTSVVCVSKMQVMVKTNLNRIVGIRLAKEAKEEKLRKERERKEKVRLDSIKKAEEQERQRREDSLRKAEQQKRLEELKRQRYIDSVAAVQAERARIEEQRRKDSIAAAQLRQKQMQDSLDLLAKKIAALEKRKKELAVAEAKRKAQRLAELKKSGIKNPEIFWDLEENMVEVKGGEFKMGCTVDQIRDCEADERPVRNTEVSDFKIAKYEVTQELWDIVMDTNVSGHQDCAKCPVENIRFGDVQVFIGRLNKLTGKKYRLPTEAEWEYAARGGNKAGTNAPALSDMAWYGINSGNTTHEVGQLKPNALGLYDMLGNVWEYCVDWYDPAYYSTQNLSNPKGPSSGSEYVIRGGSYFGSASECRVANRNSVFPIMTHKSYGFRLAE